jgi:hypothetical protein
MTINRKFIGPLSAILVVRPSIYSIVGTSAVGFDSSLLQNLD